MENKFLNMVLNPGKLLYALGSRGYLNFLSDESFLKIMYSARMNKKLNLENPTTFNEKIQWLKLYDRKSEYTQMVDKYEVREYVEEKIGSEYLIPLYGVWNNIEDINWSILPQKFVLKSTHDSGGVVLCDNKETFDYDLAKHKLSRSLKHNYYYQGREWPYKHVQPRIIAEKYMKDEESNDLKDYKFFCFNGEVKLTLVVADINSNENVKRNFYDKNWELLSLKEGNAPNTDEDIAKPVNYNKMIEIAEILAEELPFIRVDLYEINHKIYFGELTFYPNNGTNQFNPRKYDEIMGNWITLPEKT